MRITEKNKKDFEKLNNYNFDYNYYSIGKPLREILEELDIIQYSLDKWMIINNKSKRSQGDRRLAHEKYLLLASLGKILTYDLLYQEYIQNMKSIVQISKEYNTCYNHVWRLLEYYSIPLRNIKEATSTEKVKKNRKLTCIEKYGVENPSQAREVKDKKAETFLKNYGVDNIFKSENFIKELESIMLKKYGKKRITNIEKLLEGGQRWREENKEYVSEFYSSLAKKTWNSLSKEEQDLKMIEMRKNIPKEVRCSFLEYRILDILNKNSIWNIHQFFCGLYSFDFFLGNKLLLEVNGDYWHANPIFYNETDILRINKGKDLTAKEIWDKDKEKREFVEGKGFTLFYLWENAINNLIDEEILFIIQEKIYENKKNKKNKK